ncbi:MAG: hypothetical protein NC434_13965 [Ruminococcus sp.]|nr:hypothetical protein [Ruminococcus sp.]
MIAYWNGMTWECGQHEISRIESLSTSFSMQTETNADKEGVSPTETVGLNEVDISLNTTYRIETGTADIKGMISAWKAMIGKAAPLIIGSEIFGPDKVQLQSVDVSNIQMRANGLFTAATLGFKFKEYIEEPVVAAVSGTRGAGAGLTTTGGTENTLLLDGGGTEVESAVTIGATESDKLSKKTVFIGKSARDYENASYTKKGITR